MSTVKEKLDKLEQVLKQTNKDLKDIKDNRISLREKLTLILFGAACTAIGYIIVMAMISML